MAGRFEGKQALVLGVADAADPAPEHKRWSVDVASTADVVRELCGQLA